MKFSGRNVEARSKCNPLKARERVDGVPARQSDSDAVLSGRVRLARLAAWPESTHECMTTPSCSCTTCSLLMRRFTTITSITCPSEYLTSLYQIKQTINFCFCNLRIWYCKRFYYVMIFIVLLYCI